MLIKYLSGPKTGTILHAPSNQNTQQLIDLGFAKAVDPHSAEAKRFLFTDSTGKPMQPKQGGHRWLANRNPFNGWPELILITPPPVEEVCPYRHCSAENAEAFFQATNYRIYLPIPAEVLASYAADLKRWHGEVETRENNRALHSTIKSQ